MSGDETLTMDMFSQSLRIAFVDQGEGGGVLILHGGAGSGSALGLANALSKAARVIAPTHPGFDGQPRPDWFAGIDDLVLAYLTLIERLDLSKVVVVGNSVGGWIAAEMALRHSPRLAGVVLLNAVGVDTGSPERSIVDPMKLPPAERAAFAFHDPARFAIAPSSPEALAAMLANQQTLRVYAGEPFMHDPSLMARLAGVSIPAMVVWGESDRIADVEYGRRFASAIPGAQFELIREAGHFPHIEKLDEVSRLIASFAASL